MNSNNEKPVSFATAAETRKITRRVLAWLDTFPGLPVKQVTYGGLAPNRPGIALFSPQGAVIRKRYILGGYLAEYPFSLVYRIVKPGASTEKRLQADEILDTLGDWAAARRPCVGEGARTLRVEIAARAALSAVHPNGDEEHEIQLKILYEVV